MMTSEFIERTGFASSAEAYVRIEVAHCGYGGGKDALCAAFVRGTCDRDKAN